MYHLIPSDAVRERILYICDHSSTVVEPAKMLLSLDVTPYFPPPRPDGSAPVYSVDEVVDVFIVSGSSSESDSDEEVDLLSQEAEEQARFSWLFCSCVCPKVKE